MQLSDVFLQLGEERLRQLVRGISIGKLRTYQLYERFKTRTHLPKVNTENLRKAVPRFWERLKTRRQEFATDLSQAILIAHLDMIRRCSTSSACRTRTDFSRKIWMRKQF